MKQIRLIPALLISAALCQSVHGDILRSSQFIGYGTGNLGADANTGSLDGWQNSTAQVTVTNGSGSLDGTALGLVASAGDKVFISTNTALNVRNYFIPANGTFPQTIDTNLYFSFLYKFVDASAVSPDGEVIMRMNRANSGTGTPQHWDLIAKNVGGQMQVGIAKAGGNITNYSSINISQGQVFFTVVRQHIIPGAQNDVYDLWINPPPQFFGTNEANIPPSDATVGTNPSDGTEDTSSTGPGRCVVAAGVGAEFDEFRAATTWAEVTPWFGQCVPAGVAVSPVSVTNSAEIAATFRVYETGTSPTFQWQLSTNAGSTWSDIVGANNSVYTTPNLTLSDNGNQYRAIVLVDCNGSSATSSVASVTLTTPVPTPVGTVMDDTFDTGFRDLGPLTADHSLWFTHSDYSSYLINQNGDLFAAPISGSSSLWLGFFTDTNQPPVHLAVGRSFKATLKFKPTSFNSFTNNAGLRLGIFDYYDAGHRPVADIDTLGGSTGQGDGVRGYMLNIDWGTNFTANSPLQLLARNFLSDNNLIGTTSDYESLGSGPAGGGYSNAPAFMPGVEYTLEFTVTRTAVNTVGITATITGGGTNWSHNVTETNYAYHRFDSFAIRPNSLETSADSFSFTQFKVEVSQSAVSVPPFNITRIETLSPGSVKLTWDSVSGATYHVLSRDTITGTDITNATIVATGSSTSYTNSPAAGTSRFYRVLAPPYTP